MSELLSVIIPNFNKEAYIEQCLDSVLSQSYSNVEIIIVDDQSSDRSPEIIKQYQKAHQNIRGILLPENRGVSQARNIGIAAASGRYVTMLDSDDFYYSPDKLKNEMELLLRQGGRGIAYSYRQVVDENGELLYAEKKDLHRYVSGHVFYRFLTEKDACSFVQRDFIVPKETVVAVGGYREGESYYEDFDLLLRLLKELPLYYTGADGTAYRVLGSGLSNTQKKNDGEQFRVPQKIRKRYINQLDGPECFQAWVLWGVECCRLESRILARRIKRTFMGG